MDLAASDASESERFLPSAKVSSSIESLRFQLSNLVTRIQSRVSIDTLRPLPEFLGVNSGTGLCLSPGAFTAPVKKVDKGTFEKIKSRVQLNFAFFLTNYVLIAAMTAIVVALMHPGMIFFVGIVYGLWSLHSYMIRNELVVFGIRLHTLLSVQHRFYLLFILTTLVVILKCLIPALIFVAISGFLVLLHASLRDPKHIETSIHPMRAADSDDDFDLEGGGQSEDNASEVMVERPQTRGDII